ncbi:transcription antitermination factor NusB [Microbacterium sp. NPDC076895]|uniref:RsmB/NOP family class I SAM-dependent RNA methyltransferase n=1 Tax=Microbacterium sp. NPDC076895 TaxID=3154957 RepID=UPI0034333ACF
MSGAPSARQVAFDTLRAVHDADAYANLVLPTAIARARLSPADAALATELTYGTLRQQGTWDAVIAVAANRPAESLDPPVLDILRLGVHQLLATRVPPHAAVNESVSLTRSSAGERAVGFVNAVLRKVGEADAETWISRAEDAARSDEERLSVRTSHPVWVIRALRRALDDEGRASELLELLAADNDPPRVTMAALPGLATAPEESEPTSFSPYGFRAPAGDPGRLVAASNGALRVQDEGSQLAALALSEVDPVRPGERWLDLCAGPGGKTALLAARVLQAREAGIPVDLEANEVSSTRAGLVRRSLEPIPFEVVVSEEDGRERVGANAYDRILVDAPCTGLGALRRRPESRWRKSPQDVAPLADLQRELLSAAVTGLRPGGVVAYVTCSPHLVETRDVVAAVRDQHRDELDELDARDVLHRVSRSALDLASPTGGGGRAQLWPHRHGTDAMSITLLRRRS